jgi:DNA-binding NarL/FixJ family response regulator
MQKNETGQVRILLVDDHDAIRESWKFFLEKNSRFVVVGQCSNGRDAVAMARQILPDIILMDINMKILNGFEATRQIVQSNPGTGIIGITINNHPGYASKMLELGARGFVTKSSSFSELTTAILKVHAGETYVCEEISSDKTQRRGM